MSGDGERGVGQGVAWSALNAAVLRLSQFLVGVLVAHLVSPHEFGVYVVAYTAYLIAFSINDVGVTSAIVRERDRGDAITPTATTISITTSLALALAMVFTASQLAAALGAPSAASAVRIIAITILLTGISAPSAAQLTRDLRQKEQFVGDASMFLMSSVVLVSMALHGEGVMALAWSRVAGQLTSTIIVIVLAPRWYRPGFDRRAAKDLLKFGLPLAGEGFIWYSMENVDFVVVGRLLGAAKLGLYNLAYNISSWPTSILRNVLNSVSLPTLARVQDDREKLQVNLTASLSALAALSFPVSAICLGVARPLVEAVYGARWMSAAAVLAILVTFGSVRGVIGLLCDVFVAIGKTRVLFVVQLAWLAVLVPTMVAGVKVDGIRGAAWAHLFIGAAVLLPVYLIVLQRVVGIPAGPLIRAMLPPALAAVPTAVVAYAAANSVGNPWAALAAGSGSGLIVYLGLLAIWLRRLISLLRYVYGKSGDNPPVRNGPKHAMGRRPRRIADSVQGAHMADRPPHESLSR